jgi:intracellular septation protein A
MSEEQLTEAQRQLRDITPGSLIRESGPRILRDGLGPTLTFYAGWKLSGLLVGVIAASLFSFACFRHEHRHGRPGLIASLVLLFVVLHATVGLIAHSATVYLVQPVVLSGVQGLLWLGSVAIGRPLAALFAREIFEFPPEVKQSALFKTVFTRISATFGVYFIISGLIQVLILVIVGVDVYVGVHAAGIVGIVLLAAWAIRYSVNTFRANDEWALPLAPEAT